MYKNLHELRLKKRNPLVFSCKRLTRLLGKMHTYTQQLAQEAAAPDGRLQPVPRARPRLLRTAATELGSKPRGAVPRRLMRALDWRLESAASIPQPRESFHSEVQLISSGHGAFVRLVHWTKQRKRQNPPHCLLLKARVLDFTLYVHMYHVLMLELSKRTYPRVYFVFKYAFCCFGSPFKIKQATLPHISSEEETKKAQQMLVIAQMLVCLIYSWKQSGTMALCEVQRQNRTRGLKPTSFSAAL